MGYKQSPFPMHKGTSNHTSAVKQIEAETLRKLYEDNPELDQRPVAGPREATAKEKQKIQKKRDKQLKKELKDKRKSELSEAKDKGKAARKEEKYQAKLDKAGESIEERKARKIKRNEELKKTLNPIFQAMSEPISRGARGVFPEHGEKKGKGKWKKKYKKLLEETKKTGTTKKGTTKNGTKKSEDSKTDLSMAISGNPTGLVSNQKQITRDFFGKPKNKV